MAFTIVYKPSAERELAGLSRRVRRQIRREIQRKLVSNPREAPGTDYLRAEWEGHWKLRVGEYRVIYEIEDRATRVRIVRVRHRSQAYEQPEDR